MFLIIKVAKVFNIAKFLGTNFFRLPIEYYGILNVLRIKVAKFQSMATLIGNLNKKGKNDRRIFQH